MISLKPFLHRLLFCTFLLPAFAYADQPPIPGEDDPAYLDAVETWLNGDDLPALQALSDLSHDGNTAAQILLARIAGDVSYHSHITAPMNRQDRITLMKMPGGLSGKSWLNAAAENSEFAEALIQSALAVERLKAIPVLFRYGENVIATRSARVSVYMGRFAPVMNLLNSAENLPDEALPLWVQLDFSANNSFENGDPYWFTYEGIAPSDDLISRGSQISEALKLQDLFPGIKEFAARDPDRVAEIREMANTVPYWEPYAQFCSRHCPEDVTGCTAAAGAVASLGNQSFAMSSPSQRLLPNHIYWNSPRVEADLVRRMLDLRRRDDFLASVDNCFVPTIARLQTEMDLPQ